MKKMAVALVVVVFLIVVLGIRLIMTAIDNNSSAQEPTATPTATATATPVVVIEKTVSELLQELLENPQKYEEYTAMRITGVVIDQTSIKDLDRINKIIGYRYWLGPPIKNMYIIIQVDSPDFHASNGETILVGGKYYGEWKGGYGFLFRGGYRIK